MVRVGGLFIAAKGHDPHVSLGYWSIVHSAKFTNILSATNISSISYVFWQEEIRSAKAAVGKLGASMLDLCNGKLSSLALKNLFYGLALKILRGYYTVF